jgi:hypothetical protein
MRKIRVRVETNFASRFNPITPVQSSREKYSALCSPQISRIIPRIPPRAEGRIAIVTNVEAGSGGRETSQHASMIRSRRPRSAKRVAVFLPTSASRLRRDRAQSKACGRTIVARTAKPCGPDTPTLVSSLRRRVRVARVTVARKPGSPRRARSKPLKPLRREGRRVSAVPVVPAPCFFSRTGAAGASRHPAFPAPSH